MIRYLEHCVESLTQLMKNKDADLQKNKIITIKNTELLDISSIAPTKGMGDNPLYTDINLDMMYEYEFIRAINEDYGDIYLFAQDKPTHITFAVYTYQKKDNVSGLNCIVVFDKTTRRVTNFQAHDTEFFEEHKEQYISETLAIIFRTLYINNMILENKAEKYYTQPTKIIVRDRKSKTKEKVQKVTYIYLSKNQDTKSVTRQYGKITRDFSWQVRGHWRVHNGTLGKDRDGNYNVKGYTWVIPHIKGKGELKHSIKVVKA